MSKISKVLQHFLQLDLNTLLNVYCLSFLEKKQNSKKYAIENTL